MRFWLFARADGSEQSRNLLAAIMLSSASVEPQQQCLIVRALRSQVDSFNACNQLWNADRLGKKWICGPIGGKDCFGTT